MSNINEEKLFISPESCMYPNEDHSEYHIEIELPGVEKESITLKMHEDSFFVKGETDEVVYIGSYTVCCEVDPEKVKARRRG